MRLIERRSPVAASAEAWCALCMPRRSRCDRVPVQSEESEKTVAAPRNPHHSLDVSVPAARESRVRGPLAEPYVLVPVPGAPDVMTVNSERGPVSRQESRRALPCASNNSQLTTEFSRRRNYEQP